MNISKYFATLLKISTQSDRRFHQKGIALIYLIMAMVVLALLGSAAVVMFSSSSLMPSSANASQRATYLAESGLRFARGEFRSATNYNKNAVLNGLNSNTYNLSGNDGKFYLAIEPYWFNLTALANATSISPRVPGNVPASFSGLSAGGFLYIDGTFYSYPNGPDFLSNTASLSITPNLTNNVTNGPVFIVSTAASNSPSGATSVTLTGNYFPPQHGLIGICDSITGGATCNNLKAYPYETATLSGTNTTLTFRSSPVLPLITSGQKIILLGTVKITSTGTYSESVSRVAESFYRLMNFYSSSGTETVTATAPVTLPGFDFKSQDIYTYLAPTDPNQASMQIKQNVIATQNGESVLNISERNWTTGLNWAAQTGTGQIYANVNLATLRQNNNYLLDYDIQVKIAFKEQVQTDNLNLIMGISFRLDDTDTTATKNLIVNRQDSQAENMYGLSFFRVTSSYAASADSWYQQYNFNSQSNWSNLVGTNWYIILWKRINGVPTLLAYKNISGTSMVDSSTGRLRPWVSLMVKVEEGIALSGDWTGFYDSTKSTVAPFNRYNVIKVFYRSPIDTPLYANDSAVDWTEAYFDSTFTSTANIYTTATTKTYNGNTYLLDQSLNTKSFDQTGTFSYPREIGLHQYYPTVNSQATYFDDFYFRITSGFSGANTNTGYLQ